MDPSSSQQVHARVGLKGQFALATRQILGVDICSQWKPLFYLCVHLSFSVQVRQIDTDVNFRPVYRDSVRGSLSAAAGDVGKLGVSVRTSSRESSTASEALTDFVAPLLEGEGGSREGGASPRLGAKVEMEKREGKEEEDSSLVLLVSSDDRLEVTLSPGALETLLKIVEV